MRANYDVTAHDAVSRRSVPNRLCQGELIRATGDTTLKKMRQAFYLLGGAETKATFQTVLMMETLFF